MKKFIHRLIIGSLILGSSEAAFGKKPNVVLVLADDLGLPQMGYFGNAFYETPHLDEFASQSAVFAQAYSAAAVCSPTRAALYTGKNPARLQITDFIKGNDGDEYPFSQPDWQRYLPLEEKTIGEVFKEDGYRTALFGKWHLSPDKTPPASLSHNPTQQGFDEEFVTYKPADGYRLGEWQTAEDDAHSVDRIAGLGIEFIKRNQNEPFLLIVSHNSIHDPIMEKGETVAKFEQKEGADREENNAIIAAMVERLDASFGRLHRTLEELALLEDTIIIFYSDNGAKHAYFSQEPFRAGKGWLYEGGIRVPLIVQWKGKIRPRTIEDPVTSMDLVPTIARMAGVTHPLPAEIDGMDLSSALLDGAKLPERCLYWNYPHYHAGSGMKPAAAIRCGDYKLIEWYEQSLTDEAGAYELYNLKNDPGERKNLIERKKGKFRELKEKLERWKTEVGAQEPTVKESLRKTEGAL